MVHTVNRDHWVEGYLLGRSRVPHRMHDYRQFLSVRSLVRFSPA
jgi:hypothetical protein